MKDPTLRQIKYFIAAANSGQVSKAATELSVSQSAVTVAIRQLEEIVGEALFARHSNGLTLTYSGNIFMEHALRVVSTVQEAVVSPTRLRDSVEGKLRLAVTGSVAGYFLPPYLERFGRAFPKIEFDITEAQRIGIEDGLVSGIYDLAFMQTTNISDQESLTYEIFVKSKRRLWLSAQHPLLNEPAVTLAAVANHPYIMLTLDEGSNNTQRYWNRTPYRPKTIFRTSSVEAVRAMVASNMGIAILSDLVYRPWSFDGRRVEAIDLVEEIPTLDVGLVWAVNIDHPPAAAAFVRFMSEHMLAR